MVARVLALALALALTPGLSLAFESFDVDFRLESSLAPDIDTTSTITGTAGDTVPFTVVMDLGVTSDQEAPAQGWSLGVWTSGFEIESVSVDGTISAPRSLGGVFDSEFGFIVFEIADPERSLGRSGVVQGVVLSLLGHVELPYFHRYDIGRIECRATVEPAGRVGFARVEESLAGVGQPVENVFTVDGRSVSNIGMGHRDIVIGSGAPAEDCGDGIDNDGDGWTDAGDPDCFPPRSREICDDGEDNDHDVAVDCDDSECFFRPPCPSVEICGNGLDDDRNGDADCDDAHCDGHPYCIAREICDDGVDNDNDGLADCDDRDCGGILSCPPIERCLDDVDNDDDGVIDCDDSDCFGSPFCGSFESCADGKDNNGDGLVDCEDPQCAEGPACGVTEVCDDGIDNDDDGFLDCDDSQCRGVGDCPGPERCGDGRDNDRDGDVDCDDGDCERDRLCVDPEICDDGVDNDRDGRVDCDDSQCRGRGGCPGPEDCADEIDNDRDGNTDCDDSDCETRARCRSEDCDDGVDNDVDGLIDCDDPECAGRDGCVLELCDNDLDDDADGLIDCDDPACRSRSPCYDGKSGFDLVLVADGAVRERRLVGDGAGAGVPRAPINVLEVDESGSVIVEVTTYVVPVPASQPEGIQGWSLSVTHDSVPLDIIGAPTIEGTDAAELYSTGFEQTETVDSDGDGGGASDGEEGVVSAVVLSLTQPSVLDPANAQSILKTTYELDGEAPTGSIRFRDGLRGSGQPVSNIFTIAGDSVRPVHLVPLELRRPATPFVRGDINSDRKVDIADAVWALNELMRGGPPTSCVASADVNDDGSYDIADPVYVLQFGFLHGPSIPPPFPACGIDAGERGLPCAAACEI